MAKIDAVTCEDVKAMATRIGREAPMALAMYGPLGAAPDFQSLQERRAA